MSLSVQVMAHPSRKDMVTDLLHRLDRDVGVTWDEVNDRHDTGIRAMTAYDPTCSHHLVIQDDVLPCADLIAGAERALAWVPDGRPCSLYLGAVRPFRRAVAAAVETAGDASWITMKGIYWGPAVILPTHLIDEMADWYLSPRGSRTTNYDRRMSVWFEKRGLDCWYSWPSLVDHRGDESLIRGRHAVRHAHRALGPAESALTVDWTGPVAAMERTDRLDRQRQRRAVA